MKALGIVLALVIIVATVAFVSFVIMALSNAVLAHYDIKLLTFPVSIALTALFFFLVSVSSLFRSK